MSNSNLTWDAIRNGRVKVATESSFRATPGARRARSMSVPGQRELLSFRLAGEEYALDILRVREIIKVMDFGLARLTTAYFIPFEKLTGTGSNIGGGTPDYVAPEQVRG